MIVWRISGKIFGTVQCCVVMTIVHSYKHTHMSSSYRCGRDYWFRRLVWVFCVVSYLRPFCLFCVFDIFSLVYSELFVLEQVIAWKDSSPK